MPRLAPEERAVLLDAARAGFGDRPLIVDLLCSIGEEIGLEGALEVLEKAEQDLIDLTLEDWQL
ncbi:MAG TPA: hypothetical protein VNJ70_17925 [Thermoanaerobaculia bacterium]|nr:hypothetical protein [Thermoanaerobaculia bacterium]